MRRCFLHLCESQVEKPHRGDILVAVGDNPRLNKTPFCISPIGAAYFRQYCYAPMGLNTIFYPFNPALHAGLQIYRPDGALQLVIRMLYEQE